MLIIALSVGEMSNMGEIRVSNLTKNYGDLVALSNVSLVARAKLIIEEWKENK